MGDPILLQFHQGPHGTDLEFRIQLGHAHPLCAPVHPVGVLQRAEHLQAAVLAAVGLETFKNFLAVVEHGGGGVNGQGAIGLNAGVVPAPAFGVLYQEHVVGKQLAEGETRLILRLFLRVLGFDDLNVELHDGISSSLI